MSNIIQELETEQMNKTLPDFGPGDYSVDEKARQVFLSDQGHEKVEQMLSDAGLLAEGRG